MEKEAFAGYLQSRGYTQDTLTAYLSDLEIFQRYLQSRTLRISQVGPTTMLEFAAYLTSRPGRSKSKSAPRTVSRRLAAVSSYFEFLNLRSNGKVRNPVGRLCRPRLRRRDPDPMADDAVERLDTEIDNPRDRALLMFLRTSMLRLSEVYGLDRDSIKVQIEMKDGVETAMGIGRVTGKGGKEREFLVDEETLILLSEYLRTRTDHDSALFISNRKGRLSKRGIEAILHRWCRRLNIKKYRLHQLRHTGATYLGNSGMSLIALRDLMGHSSVSTTLQYFKLKKSRMLQEYFAAMSNVPSLNSGGTAT